MAQVTVIGGETGTGWWRVWARPPAAPLRGLVTRYAGYREHSAAPVRRCEVPAGEVSMILSFGPAIEVGDSGPAHPGERAVSRDIRTSFVTAVNGRRALTEYIGEQYGLQITMTPLAAGMILGTWMGEFGDRATTGLADVLGPPGRRLVERLAAAPGWPERFDIADGFLLARLSRAHTPSPVAARAWGRLRETGGRISVGALAGEMACSTRYLSAQVRAHVGVGPKLLARMLRVQRAIRLVEAGTAGLTEIAHACGYADQSHLGRDFQAMTGVSPGVWTVRPLAAIPELASLPSGVRRAGGSPS